MGGSEIKLYIITFFQYYSYLTIGFKRMTLIFQQMVIETLSFQRCLALCSFCVTLTWQHQSNPMCKYSQRTANCTMESNPLLTTQLCRVTSSY